MINMGMKSFKGLMQTHEADGKTGKKLWATTLGAGGNTQQPYKSMTSEDTY